MSKYPLDSSVMTKSAQLFSIKHPSCQRDHLSNNRQTKLAQNNKLAHNGTSHNTEEIVGDIESSNSSNGKISSTYRDPIFMEVVLTATQHYEIAVA